MNVIVRKYSSVGKTEGMVNDIYVRTDLLDARDAASRQNTATSATAECMDCGEPATHITADGVPLCDGDYAELCRAAGGEEWA
jgi:hypothetical protein